MGFNLLGGLLTATSKVYLWICQVPDTANAEIPEQVPVEKRTEPISCRQAKRYDACLWLDDPHGNRRKRCFGNVNRWWNKLAQSSSVPDDRWHRGLNSVELAVSALKP
jgi:hypothetical protein